MLQIRQLLSAAPTPVQRVEHDELLWAACTADLTASASRLQAVFTDLLVLCTEVVSEAERAVATASTPIPGLTDGPQGKSAPPATEYRTIAWL